MAPKKVKANAKAAASPKNEKEEKLAAHEVEHEEEHHEEEHHEEEHEDDAKKDAKPKMRKPTVSGSNFAKEFEHTLKHKFQIKAEAADILSALFETIKNITEKTIQDSDDKGELINVAKKGICINMPSFEESGENIKNTIKFDVKLSKTKKGYIPRMTMSLHKKFKDSINKDLANYFESAMELIESA